MPRGTNLEIPDRSSNRKIPFIDWGRMTGYLLDTNVISELTRDDPDPRVVSFLSEHDDVWLPTVLIHEVEYGLRLLPQGRRRRRLAEMQSSHHEDI